MLENLRRCELCSTGNKPVNGFPDSHHPILRCPEFHHCCRTSVRDIRRRSPGSCCCKEAKSSRQSWAATLKAATVPRSADGRYTNRKPTILRSSFTNVEKTNSCPDRTCSCIAKVSSRCTTKPLTHCSIKSQSTVHICNPPINTQIAERIVYSEEIVSELKDEIEKVKSQLHQISLQNFETQNENSSGNMSGNKTMSKLKSENRRLTRELEQIKRGQQESIREVEKARDVMDDYEKKVALLHQQALKSSKILKQSKDRFCKCLKEKENLIEDLQNNNKDLTFCITEKDLQYRDLNKAYENLQVVCEQNDNKCEVLSGNNKKFCECIQMLEKQLQSSLHESQQYKEEIKKVEQRLANFKCTTCQRLEVKMKKQKEKFENRLKEYEEKENMLKKQNADLTSKIKEIGPEKVEEFKKKIMDYETCVAKCKHLEEECKNQCDTILRNEKQFEKERGDLMQLVDELTTVVKQNKVTLLQLSSINKEQEVLLETQSVILLEKEEKIQWAENTIEMMKSKSTVLEREVDVLRKSLSGPCINEACECLSKELEETKNALNLEKDNHLMKEKIIADQTQTICSLQQQIKEKISELAKAKEKTDTTEEEMSRISSDLLKKRSELEKELREKDNLLQKLKKLEIQKIQLANEMKELDHLLQRYRNSNKCDKKQQAAIVYLQKQIEQQRSEWEAQKENLYMERENAVSAAKFATQKLLDTVADFQTQVNTQRKVQIMLTRLLHEKEEELKSIKSKMSSINSITSETDTVNEIYKRNNRFNTSNPTTTSATSFHSICSNCSTLKSSLNYDKIDLRQLFKIITQTEEPIRDVSVQF